MAGLGLKTHSFVVRFLLFGAEMEDEGFRKEHHEDGRDIDLTSLEGCFVKTWKERDEVKTQETIALQQ